MDGAEIQAKVYYGLAKAGGVIGFSYKVNRPKTTITALGNVVADVKAYFAGDVAFTKPILYGKPVCYAALDGSQIQVGDYLVPYDGSDIFFIAQMSSKGIIAVKCNAELRMSRTVTDGASGGALGYSGVTDARNRSMDKFGQQTPYIGWPCSLIEGRGAERYPGALPSSPKSMPGWQILMAASVPAQIVVADRFFDVTGRIFSVLQAEQSDLGWRIAAAEVHA